MQRGEDRILTTHTGSLPRPEALEKAMLDGLEGKEQNPGQLQKMVDDATNEVVRRQTEIGVDVVGDGEVGKPSYATYVQQRLEGFGGESGPLVIKDLVDYPEAGASLMEDPGFSHVVRPACVGPISARDRGAVDQDVARLKEVLDGVNATEAFMTAVSPATISMFQHNQYYPDQESYLRALAEAMKPEYTAIVESGLILQVDCPDLGCAHALTPDASAEEVKRNIAMYVDVLNEALANLPPDRMRMHVCWGNYEGPHHYDIPLHDIIDQVLRARPQGLLLEAANPRHEHEWQVFEDVRLPDDKVLIPGVVDTTNNYIEHPELIAQRIIRYANTVGPEKVMAGTDCGFGTMVGFRATAPAIAWAKLEAMSQGAEIATRKLW